MGSPRVRLSDWTTINSNKVRKNTELPFTTFLATVVLPTWKSRKTVFSQNSRQKGRNQFLLIQFNPQSSWSFFFLFLPLLPSHPLTLGWGTEEQCDGCRTAWGNWRSVHPTCFCWKPLCAKYSSRACGIAANKTVWISVLLEQTF